MIHTIPVSKTALVLVDLQNDFLHADGAYARGGQKDASIAALPARLKPLVDQMRDKGGWIVATLFTLVPDRDGEPMISPHLKSLRPFLKSPDFAPGSWGQKLVDELQPAHIEIEKIAYSAFYMTRLEWVLRKAGIEKLIFAGIVTNGGVTSTLRDAHIRDFETVVLSDGCAAFGADAHQSAIAALGTIARVTSVNDMILEVQNAI